VTLAAFSDGNESLDGTKLSFTDANDENFKAAAAVVDPLIKGALYDLYPAHVGLWIETLPISNPNNLELSPALVRVIAGMLYAAQYYAKKYSEETLDGNDYAARLEAKALAVITGLLDGTYQLYDELSYQAATQGLQQDDFWPNDLTVVKDTDDLVGLSTGDPLRFFRMNQSW
jgi:hypothetical protein